MPIHLGLVARTCNDGRTAWLEGLHASHWAWPDLKDAVDHMRQHKERGATVLVLLLWSPVWTSPSLSSVQVGHPEHHDGFVRSLCWSLSVDEVPDAWARRWESRGGESRLDWRHLSAGDVEQVVL